MATDDGGSAFPGNNFTEGMTLRQWYAGLAMLGWMPLWRDAEAVDMAAFAFGVADAMIAKSKA